MTETSGEGQARRSGEPMSSVRPYDRRAEVEAILASDDTLLGRVYRYDLAP